MKSLKWSFRLKIYNRGFQIKIKSIPLQRNLEPIIFK